MDTNLRKGGRCASRHRYSCPQRGAPDRPDAQGVPDRLRQPRRVLPRTRSPLRRATSAGFAFGVRRLLGLPYRDTQCGAKALRREAVDRILPHVGSRDLLFDVELLLAARDAGQPIVEVPTVWIDQ